MPNKTTQILKEFRFKFNEVVNRMYHLEILPDIQSRIDERIPQGGFNLFSSEELEQFLTEALSHQQQEDYQEVLDLDIMKDENNAIGGEGYKTVRDQFRKELRSAIAEKRGKV
jgi:Tfp pilus assembly pilus retraction ATPase PilT